MMCVTHSQGIADFKYEWEASRFIEVLKKRLSITGVVTRAYFRAEAGYRDMLCELDEYRNYGWTSLADISVEKVHGGVRKPWVVKLPEAKLLQATPFAD